MQKFFSLVILLITFYGSAFAFSFTVESYVSMRKDSVLSSDYNKPGKFELQTGNFGNGWEKYINFQVDFNPATYHAFGAWFRKGYNSRFMLCDLQDDTRGVTQSVYVLTYKTGPDERCLIFYPLSDDRVIIYELNVRNVTTQYYQVFNAYGKNLYKNIIHEIGEAYSANAITATGCDGYLNGIRLISDRPKKE